MNYTVMKLLNTGILYIHEIGHAFVLIACDISFHMWLVFGSIPWCKEGKALLPLLVSGKGVQPFAIAGRITFIYMKYSRQ